MDGIINLFLGAVAFALLLVLHYKKFALVCLLVLLTGCPNQTYIKDAVNACYSNLNKFESSTEELRIKFTCEKEKELNSEEN